MQILEYLRFLLFAALLLAGLFIEVTALVGFCRLGHSLNRIHPAGMGDILGLLLISLAAIVYVGFDAVTLKILLVVGFFWLTSPVAGHLIGRLVSQTDEKFESEARPWKP